MVRGGTRSQGICFQAWCYTCYIYVCIPIPIPIAYTYANIYIYIYTCILPHISYIYRKYLQISRSFWVQIPWTMAAGAATTTRTGGRSGRSGGISNCSTSWIGSKKEMLNKSPWYNVQVSRNPCLSESHVLLPGRLLQAS